MNPILPRFAHGVLCGGALSLRSRCCRFLPFLCYLAGCGPSVNHYLLIEQSLFAGDPQRAAAIVEQTEKEYGAKGRFLYDMDRGMVLQLAGHYQQSSAALERAEEEVERLYTRTIRSETAAFLTNDNALAVRRGRLRTRHDQRDQGHQLCGSGAAPGRTRGGTTNRPSLECAQ